MSLPLMARVRSILGTNYLIDITFVPDIDTEAVQVTVIVEDVNDNYPIMDQEFESLTVRNTQDVGDVGLWHYGSMF